MHNVPAINRKNDENRNISECYINTSDMNITSNVNNEHVPVIVYTTSSVYLGVVGFLGVGLNSTALGKLIRIIRVFKFHRSLPFHRCYFDIKILIEGYLFSHSTIISEKKYGTKFHADQSNHE